jgi:hypothetical protein
LLHESSESISEFLDICIEIWDIWKGAYGFIDIKESSPLKDDLFRNAIHLLDDTIPEPLVPEFKAWVDIKYTLNRHIWKAFWGNFLCFEHICYLGEKAISRNKPTHTANFPRTADYFYQIGIQELQQCACVHTLQVLKNRGVLLAISQSPMQWFQSDTQKDLAKLQDTLTPISINWQ